MATMKDVAKVAGVSVATVSHVVNQTRYVSTDTRKRVVTAMEALNYQGNALARALRKGFTRTIGLIMPDSSNPFFAEIGRSSETAFFEAGYSTIFCNTDGSSDKIQHYLNVLQEKQVDGIIFVAANEQTALLNDVLALKFPVVLMVDWPTEDVPADSVQADTFGGGYAATRHLISLGHRRIACIAAPYDNAMNSSRVLGYRKALEEAGIDFIDDYFIRGNFHPNSGHRAVQTLWRLPEPPSALFVYNDLMAVGVLAGMAAMGLRVPEDVSIVSFDNIELAGYLTPGLTTVEQPTTTMGELACELLLARIDNEELPFEHRVLPTKLIVRHSTSSPRPDC